LIDFAGVAGVVLRVLFDLLELRLIDFVTFPLCGSTVRLFLMLLREELTAVDWNCFFGHGIHFPFSRHCPSWFGAVALANAPPAGTAIAIRATTDAHRNCDSFISASLMIGRAIAQLPIQGARQISNCPFTQRLEREMTNGEQKVLMRGVAAGTIMGLAIGLIIALFIVMKPELFAALVR
jgi:hypothetical protein